MNALVQLGDSYVSVNNTAIARTYYEMGERLAKKLKDRDFLRIFSNRIKSLEALY